MSAIPDGVAKTNRIATRYAFTRRVRIHVERFGRTVSMDGWARDMSESGIAVFVAQPLMPGETVVLEISLSKIYRESIPARIARTRGTEYGFQFTALSSEQRSRIRETLEGRTVISSLS